MGFRRYIPNALSLSRIPLAALFILTYSPTNTSLFWISIAALVMAAVTDFFDGYLARAWGVDTRTGYFLDGMGDKGVYAAVLLVIYREDTSQGLLAWLLIVREILLYALRAIEGGRVHTLEELRPFSLFYAFFIRVYFLGFFFFGGQHLYEITFDLSRFYPVFGIIAALSGYLHMYFLCRVMAKEISVQ